MAFLIKTLNIFCVIVKFYMFVHVLGGRDQYCFHLIILLHIFLHHLLIFILVSMLSMFTLITGKCKVYYKAGLLKNNF